MKKAIKNFFEYSLLFIIYLLSLAFITSDHKWLLFIMQLAVVSLTFIYIRKGNHLKILISTCIFSILLIIGMILEEDISRGGLYLLFLPFLYLVTVKAYKKRWLLSIISIVIVVNSFLIFPNYFEWIKSFSSPKSVGVDITKLVLVDSSGENVDLPDTGYLVLDFWTTSCSQCFKKFPKFQSLANKYRNKKNISFYVINVPTKKDKNLKERVDRIEQEGYDFNKLYALNQKETETLLNFNLYPQVFIIKDGKVINTSLGINNSLVLVNNLEYNIDKLLNL